MFQPTSKAALFATLMLAVISYNLHYVCQLKQTELEERENEAVRLRNQIALAEYANSQLRAQVAHLKTDAGAEEVAREKLGLLKPGELSFVVVGAPAPSPRSDQAAQVVKPTEQGVVMRFMHWLFLG